MQIRRVLLIIFGCSQILGSGLCFRLQLKEDLIAADREALGLDEATWDELSGLEADFHQTNTSHTPNRSWLIA